MVRSAEQLRAIASPLRQQMVTLMSALGEFSVADLAERLGRSSTSLYYHLRKLEEVGLVEACGSAPSGRRHKALYTLVGGRLRVDPTRRDPEYVEALQKSARSAFRAAERASLAMLEQDGCRILGRHPDVRIQQITARLDKSRLRELCAKLQEIDDLLLEEGDGSGEVYTVTHAFSRSVPDTESTR